MQKAQKMADMTFDIIGKSCNKLMIGKCFWKTLALPSILYGTNIISVPDIDAKKLKYARIQCTDKYWELSVTRRIALFAGTWAHPS